MARIPTSTLLKLLSRQIERIERTIKGHSFGYAPGELEYIAKALKQIKSDYNDSMNVGKPLGQSPILFQRQIEQQPNNLFENNNQ